MEKKLSFYFATFSISRFLKGGNGVVISGVVAMREDHDCGSGKGGAVGREMSWCIQHTDAAVVLRTVAVIMP
jgi:hypothetical protein